MNRQQMQQCKELCWVCRTHCQQALVRHCLEMGGAHVEQQHVKLMLDCIQICQSAADFLDRESALHGAVCAACAKVCRACADSCAAIDGTEMQQCARHCRECAEHCAQMVA